MSTSLIHNMACEGELEQAHSSVFESYLPTRECGRCLEFNEMQTRDLESFLINNIILRMNSIYVRW